MELFGNTDKWRQMYKQTSWNFYSSNDESEMCGEENLLGRNNK